MLLQVLNVQASTAGHVQQLAPLYGRVFAKEGEKALGFCPIVLE
jgi:hypothetical protein